MQERATTGCLAHFSETNSGDGRSCVRWRTNTANRSAHCRAPGALRVRRSALSHAENQMNSPTVTRGQSRARIAIALAGALAVSACASTPAPTAQIEAAQLAIANAEQAGAGSHAAGELSEARAKLASANTAVQAEKMLAAAQYAEQSQVEAQLATARATSIKAQAVNEEMQRSTGTLVDEMQRVEGEAK